MTERSVKVRLRGDVSDFNRAMLEAEASTKGLTRTLDSSTDRMSNLVQTSLALGPALVPISAAAIPAITGLSNQLGIGAAAVGVTVLAFKGLGKALDAVNNASLDPTAANIQKMNLQLSELGPAGQNFVLFLQQARPELQHLQELSRAGLFPGVEKGLTSLGALLPDVERIITTVSSTLGELAAEGGANLNSPKWHEFIAFLDKEARPTLLAMGRTAGNFAEGLANLWMAFAPLENNFSQSFLGLSRDFARWTDGLDKTQGFQDFLAYVQKEGPQAFETLGSLANALLQIVEAAAPVGSAMLPAIKALADAIATLADSNLGPLIIGIVSVTAALSRLKALGKAANGGVLGDLIGRSAYGGAVGQVKALPGALLSVASASERASTKVGELSATSQRLGSSMKGAAKLAGAGAGLAFVMSGTADKLHLTNTATLAMAGSLAGPWGTAVGAGIGLALDLAKANNDVGDAVNKATKAANNSSVSIPERVAGINAEIDALKRQRDQKYKQDEILRKRADPAGEPGTSDSAGDKYNPAIVKLIGLRDKLTTAAQNQAFAEAGLAAQMANSSGATRDETYALIENVRAKNSAADAADTAFSSETNYRQALKDAAKQARTNNAGINGNSDAALKNRQSLTQLSSAWNAVADAGKATNSDMKKARANFITLAEAMGVPKKEAEALARELLHLPSPKVTVHDEATGVITDILRGLGQLHDKTITIRTNNQTHVSTIRGDKTGTNQATGGYIRGPGTTTSDSIPAWLSDREYVIKASSVDKYGVGMMHAINAGQFAAGGPVMRRYSPSHSSAPAAIGGFTSRLRDNRVRLDDNGVFYLVDTRIDHVMNGSDNHAGTNRRAGRT